MNPGTPEDDYARCRAEEFAEIPLDYVGRGKLDVHAAVENILRFADIIGGQPDLEADLLPRSQEIVAVHQRQESWQNVAEKAGGAVMKMLDRVGSSYMRIYNPENKHPVIPWISIF